MYFSISKKIKVPVVYNFVNLTRLISIQLKKKTQFNIDRYTLLTRVVL